ncbi:hypothetical protein QAD02_003030 [Eretmocerus hayati]|uniref:Uncharacterized protein n=1 Tax=Eretmocerus hayati TaxID=131215 RepID=A0ACC2NMB5_9HYME|nr:hypothetical protein QAD02_003030 [Eretmocerus hayati]
MADQYEQILEALEHDGNLDIFDTEGKLLRETDSIWQILKERFSLRCSAISMYMKFKFNRNEMLNKARSIVHQKNKTKHKGDAPTSDFVTEVAISSKCKDTREAPTFLKEFPEQEMLREERHAHGLNNFMTASLVACNEDQDAQYHDSGNSFDGSNHIFDGNGSLRDDDDGAALSGLTLNLSLSSTAEGSTEQVVSTNATDAPLTFDPIEIST